MMLFHLSFQRLQRRLDKTVAGGIFLNPSRLIDMSVEKMIRQTKAAERLWQSADGASPFWRNGGSASIRSA